MKMTPYNKNCETRIYRPIHPEKYEGDVRHIVSRSSYEHHFMRWCDLNPSVLQWSSETVCVPYRSPLDNRVRRYFVDFIIKMVNRKGETKRYLIEVKPDRFTKPPVPPKRKTKRFISEVVQWNVNNAKWAAAKKICQDRGWEFLLVTEQNLNKMVI
jgi:hypothetical protein